MGVQMWTGQLVDRWVTTLSLPLTVTVTGPSANMRILTVQNSLTKLPFKLTTTVYQYEQSSTDNNEHRHTCIVITLT